MKPWFKTAAVSVAAGMVGVFVALVCWHLWQDHEALHQIINLINQNAAQAAKAAQAAPK